MKWFSKVSNVEELKSAYRKLAMANHPDRGGTKEAMQEINEEYTILFEQLKNTHKSAYGSGNYQAKEPTKETPEDFINIVNELFRLDGIMIELCGRWLWISGNTKVHKDQLKALGCKWSQNKQMWSWHFPEDGAIRRKGKKAWEMEKIRACFGSETLSQTKEADLVPA